MHVIRHHDEANALRIHLLQLMIEDAEHNLLRMIQVKQPTSPVAREGDEMNVLLVVGNRSFGFLIHNRVAVFACKQGRATTRAPCLDFDAQTVT